MILPTSRMDRLLLASQGHGQRAREGDAQGLDQTDVPEGLGRVVHLLAEPRHEADVERVVGHLVPCRDQVAHHRLGLVEPH